MSHQSSHYRLNRHWSDPYIEQAKQILSRYVLTEARFLLDTQHATDLVLVKGNLHIAFRMRRPGYAERYPWQFTLRAISASGAPSELEKITNGLCDWLFYGHAQKGSQRVIERWLLVDLAAWRAHMIRNRCHIAHGVKANGDGTSLCWFDVTTFPPDPPLLIGASHELPTRPITLAS